MVVCVNGGGRGSSGGSCSTAVYSIQGQTQELENRTLLSASIPPEIDVEIQASSNPQGWYDALAILGTAYDQMANSQKTAADLYNSDIAALTSVYDSQFNTIFADQIAALTALNDGYWDTANQAEDALTGVYLSAYATYNTSIALVGDVYQARLLEVELEKDEALNGMDGMSSSGTGNGLTELEIWEDYFSDQLAAWNVYANGRNAAAGVFSATMDPAVANWTSTMDPAYLSTIEQRTTIIADAQGDEQALNAWLENAIATIESDYSERIATSISQWTLTGNQAIVAYYAAGAGSSSGSSSSGSSSSSADSGGDSSSSGESSDSSDGNSDSSDPHQGSLPVANNLELAVADIDIFNLQSINSVNSMAMWINAIRARELFESIVWGIDTKIVESKLENKPVAKTLINHSLQNNPPDLNFPVGHFIPSAIAKSKNYNSGLMKIVAESLNSGPGFYSGYEVLSFEEGDLLYGVHKAKLNYVIQVNADSTWALHTNVSDTYDFAISGYSSPNFALGIYNNGAVMQQALGILETYTWIAEMPILTGTGLVVNLL